MRLGFFLQTHDASQFSTCIGPIALNNLPQLHRGFDRRSVNRIDGVTGACQQESDSM